MTAFTNRSRRLLTRPLRLLPLLVAVAAAGGCYTTPGIRQRAQGLVVELSTYRDDQSTRIEKINQEYNTTFSRLIEQLTQIKTAQLNLDRRIDAQRIADRMIADVNNTLRQTFRDSFAETVKRQREEIAQADLSIAAARDAYAQSYTDAKLKLDDLDKLLSNLRVLAADEDRQQTALDFIQTVVKIEEDVRADAKKKSADQKKKDQQTDAATSPKK
jgi:hypothetical protein